ncbi:MAG: hypothetical protein AAF585_03460 [Verrucomicrobiota bacterium]
MYQFMEANPITIFIVLGSIMVTPFFVLATYAFSGASIAKGAWIGVAFLLFGATMFLVCTLTLPAKLGIPGNFIVPAAWTLPSLILYLKRDWFLSEPLSERWLVGLQIFRVIGGVFLLEMISGHIPAVFAYPAGLGDILVGVVALGVLLKYREAPRIPKAAINLVIVLGVADFISAFFFGFTSSESPLQLFFPDEPSQLLLFPTGMIPLFLVPYAIFFHTLSALNEAKFGARS